MKNVTKLHVITTIVALALLGFVQQDDKNKEVFAKLNTLEGTWQMQNSKGILYEKWVIADDKKMLGKTYRLKNNDTVFFEHVQLLLENDGIFYVPTTAGQNDEKPVSFKWRVAENDSYIFENLAHDFPKRIVYRFVSADTIHAFIDDGKPGGKRMDYYYGRVK